MDFGTLLHVAKKNTESTKNEGKYYSTKFAPPKKESKEKKLSDNIQKFLQKREQEERERQRHEKEKVASLLAMRDEKSKNKIRKMLKVTKSANKSVLAECDGEQTSSTQQGDQDDYGYVSTEANAFYQKYMEKVKDVKEDKGFAPSRPQSLRDLSGTKERVKAAITKEVEDKKTPSSSRQRTSGIDPSSPPASSSKSGGVARSYATSSRPIYDPEGERREEERKKREEDQKKAKNRRPPPPPMDFQALLKLAEKKQHEPLDLLPETKKKKEPERLLTLKEKREMEERQRAKEAREQRDRARANNNNATDEPKNYNNNNNKSTATRMEPNGRIPKLNSGSQVGKASASPAVRSASNTCGKPTSSASNGNHTDTRKPNSQPAAKGTSASAKPSQMAIAGKSSTVASASSVLASSSKLLSSGGSGGPSKTQYSGPTCELPPRDNKKTRQFPPPDVQRSRPPPPGRNRAAPSDQRKIAQAPKRRIIDDDEDEDDYDSELDDFIDDGDEEEDYSSHIKAIFGYDKAKYRNLDEEDDTAMESNFAQVQREEYISKKIGIQEDLEDMKLEAIEKKRKLMKKRKVH